MNRLIPALLLLTLVLGACSGGNSPAQTDSPQSPASTDAPATDAAGQAMPPSTEQAAGTREAVLSNVENDVKARASAADDLKPAENGMSILTGGGIETGEDGRVRLDLKPEGTIVRVGPNSSFTIPTLSEENGEPKTNIQLLFGKIFIMLKGGSVDVETPSGVASVRGSLLSVEYDPDDQRIVANCLEGHCSIEDEDGNEIDIPEGNTSFVNEGEPPATPFLMDQDEVQDWLDENPELNEFLSEIPDPEDYPDLPDDYLDTDFNFEEATPPPDGTVTDAPTDAPVIDAPTDAPTDPPPADVPTDPPPTDAPTAPPTG